MISAIANHFRPHGLPASHKPVAIALMVVTITIFLNALNLADLAYLLSFSYNTLAAWSCVGDGYTSIVFLQRVNIFAKSVASSETSGHRKVEIELT